MLVSNRRGQSYSYTLAERLASAALKGRVDLFLANCRDTREWASKAEGIPKNKFGVIYNGVDLKRFGYDKEAVRAHYRMQLNLPANAPVIGIVANLRPPKAIDVFLRAARLVSLRYPDAHFVLAGDGPQMTGMVALSRDLGLSDRAHFLGSRDDVARLLAAVDVGVLSSSSESMPNSILEYMAAGLPVVCTDVGGCREAVVHNETGLLVPPGDPEALAAAILRVCTEGRAESMGARGRARVESMFTFDGMVRRYEQLYTQLAAMGRRELRRRVAAGMEIIQEPFLISGIV
jgi:glycosyltransferase involved in cell wall biosynthesis